MSITTATASGDRFLLTELQYYANSSVLKDLTDYLNKTNFLTGSINEKAKRGLGLFSSSNNPIPPAAAANDFYFSLFQLSGVEQAPFNKFDTANAFTFKDGEITNISNQSDTNNELALETLFICLDAMYRVQLALDKTVGERSIELDLSAFKTNIQIFGDRLVNLLQNITDSSRIQKLIPSIIERASQAGVKWAAVPVKVAGGTVQWSSMLAKQDTKAQWTALLSRLHQAS